MSENISNRIKQHGQQKIVPIYKQLIEYIANFKLTEDAKQLQKATIVDQCLKQSYNINDKKIETFFQYLDACREEKVILSYAECQSEYSGLMLDFDILQLNPSTQLNDTFFHNIVNDLAKVLWKTLELATNVNLYICIIRKPKVMHKTDLSKDQEFDIYKDGFHIIIPSIQISKEAKEVIYNEIIKNKMLNVEDLEIIDKTCKIIPDEDKLAEVLDKGSIRVPVLFIGNSKNNTECYNIYKCYRLIYKENHNIYLTDVDIFNNCKSLCHEWSLNYKKKDGIIDKVRYELRESFKIKPNQVIKMNFKNEVSNDLNIAEISDPDIKEIRNMLKALSPERYKYDYWFRILCALQSKGDKYKEVAREFTINILKHRPHSNKPNEFETTWNSIKKSNSDKKINISTLYYYCNKDNPELYRQLKEETILSMLLSKIFKDDNDGNFSEMDYAKILKIGLGYKFCAVVENSTKESGYTWYEFIDENDFMEEGQLYKWARMPPIPNKMVFFISDKIVVLLKRIEDHYKDQIARSESKESIKYFNTVLKNLKMQKRTLGAKSTINNIIKLASSLFNERPLDKVFLSKLDNYENCLGVGNGVLVLGEEPKLVTGYHEYIICRSSKVNFVPRCVDNPFYEKLDKFLRAFYLDTEPDVLEFELMFLASSMDFRIKDPVFWMKKGNGKNGKSTMMEFMKVILGEYCKKLDIGMLVQGRTNADAASPAKMALDRARLVYYSESQQNERLHVAKMKEYLGCETITGRKLHQDQVEFKPRCNHVVTSNHNFIIETKDHGTWRRIYYYEYKIRFVEEHEYDPNDQFNRLIESKWISEYIYNLQCQEAFLNILCDAYKKYITVYDGKLCNVFSPTMENEKAKYRNEQDIMNKFITEKIVYSPKSNISFDTFADSYSAYYLKYKGIKLNYADIENDIITSYLKDFARSNSKEIEKHRLFDNDIAEDELLIKDYIAKQAKKKSEEMDKRIQRKINSIKKKKEGSESDEEFSSENNNSSNISVIVADQNNVKQASKSADNASKSADNASKSADNASKSADNASKPVAQAAKAEQENLEDLIDESYIEDLTVSFAPPPPEKKTPVTKKTLTTKKTPAKKNTVDNNKIDNNKIDNNPKNLISADTALDELFD